MFAASNKIDRFNKPIRLNYAHELKTPNNSTPFSKSPKLGSFTAAANQLAISQPALSQRIKKLEDGLAPPLFLYANPMASSSPISVNVCCSIAEVARDLEAEFLNSQKSNDLFGTIRIAGFSSIMRVGRDARAFEFNQSSSTPANRACHQGNS